MLGENVPANSEAEISYSSNSLKDAYAGDYPGLYYGGD